MSRYTFSQLTSRQERLQFLQQRVTAVDDLSIDRDSGDHPVILNVHLPVRRCNAYQPASSNRPKGIFAIKSDDHNGQNFAVSSHKHVESRNRVHTLGFESQRRAERNVHLSAVSDLQNKLTSRSQTAAISATVNPADTSELGHKCSTAPYNSPVRRNRLLLLLSRLFRRPTKPVAVAPDN